MFSITKSRFYYLLLMLILFTKFTQTTSFDSDNVAEDDVDDEIIVDLIVGVGMAICESFVLCRLMMLVVGVVSFIIILIGLCSGEIGCEEICNRRNARRGFATSLGYGIGRSFS